LGEVLPKKYIELNGWDYFQQHPVGSGPFKFVRYVSGDYVQYEAVDKHWRQTPDFKTLTVMLVPEESTRVASLKTKGADIIDISLDSTSSLESAGYTTFATNTISPMVQLHGAYDPRAAGNPITNIKVRQALSTAINRDEIGKTFFNGKMSPAMPPYLSEVVSDIDVSYWKKYCADLYSYDPVKAKALLVEAGYPDGFTIKLDTFAAAGADFLPKMAQIVQSYWAKIGVKTEITPIDFTNYTSWRKGPADPLVGVATTYRGIDVNPLALRPLSVGFQSTGTTGLVGKAMPELDQLINSALSETDNTKRLDMIARATKMATDSFTAFHIGHVPQMAAAGPNVDISGFANPLASPYLPTYAAQVKHRK
jgi:peptide/nickel transport system substrate-binding protein